MDCSVSKRLLNLYLDDELDDERKSALENHLIDCSDCRAEYESLVELDNLLAESSLPPAPSSLHTGIMDQISNSTMGNRQPVLSGYVQKIAAVAVFMVGLGFGGFVGLDYQNYIQTAAAIESNIYEQVEAADSSLADEYIDVVYDY